MSVFKIQQRGIVMQDEKASTTTLESDKSLGTETNTIFKPTEGAQLPVAVKEGEVATPGEEELNKPEMMVKIDGPVGRIFTDALNKLLVQESYMTMTPSLFEEKEDDDSVALQVYCWKGDELNVDDVVQITNDIAKHTSRDFVIAVESTSVTPAMALLGDLSKLPNVSVCFSQSKALDLVTSRMKK